jgi:TonB family protein
MFKFDAVDLQRVATASVGALVLTTACLAAAVAPARAAELSPASVSAWQTSVNQQIDRSLASQDVRSARQGVATVRVSFDASGELAGAAIAKSAGDARLDDAALRTARGIDYPVLPAHIRNKPVLMKVYFGKSEKTVDAARKQAKARALALDTNSDIQVANADGQPAA